MTNLTRRNFIKSGAAGLGLAALPAWVRANPTSPSSRVRIAVIGTNNRGLDHIESLSGIPEAEIAYICDVDDRALAKGVKEAGKFPSMSPKTLKDFRRALDDKSVDAVTIAVPDHWHTPMAILALAAGKHVYVEKPCSQNPYEGELLQRAIARYGKLVQMGNQRRSFPNTNEAIRQIRGGVIGRAYYAKTWYENNRGSIGRGTVVPVPTELDYELWQGPAPRRPYKSNVIPYNWHWFWHWGTGEALNNGTHEVDVARWALGVDFASKVSSTGGRYQFKDDWQTPDTQVIGWEFDGQKSISWEGRSCNGFPTEGLSRGVMIYGTEGSALLENDNFTVFDSNKKKVRSLTTATEAEGTNTRSANGITLDRTHFRNFIDSVRGEAKLNSPISEGHKSVVMLHLGNISQRVGRSLRCQASDGHIVGDHEAMKLWRRTYEPGWEPAV
ncbi:MAG TPA: Gfo/Idh/MocA family oxidoreductase [Opitutaceae bacterium]